MNLIDEPELDDREFQAWARRYQTPPDDVRLIREHFKLIANGESSEFMVCRHCGRVFSPVLVFSLIDPSFLLEHPAGSLPNTFGNQCAEAYDAYKRIRETRG